ncbi:MAG: prohibitin family protein [Anaerolineae bacterium]|jgi:regulator of protease activity HflC (stomatin/prohibitin superfamily)|nr:prohibitin family protein [Anaerolineae bacterium]MBT7073921.1 prohibitin family protein [Anaerolineae bacterium]MBT7783531.1 prohibitin family protein [Anaerolineae bacterium]
MNIAVMFQGLATLSWFAVFGIVFIIVTRATKKQPTKGIVSFGIGAFIFALAISIISAGIVFIEPQERGVVVSPYSFRAPKGYIEEALTPGLRWIVPGENVKRYEISRQTYTMSAATSEGSISGDDSIRARTKDGQEVFIDASIIYQVDDTKVTRLHIDWQDRYRNELVRPTTRGIVRDIASQYGIEEIVSSQRASLEVAITEAMEEKFLENNLLLIDFVLRDIHFSAEYAVAVEQKQIAEQQAQQAKFVVESKKQEAEQARQIAQGQADATVIAAQGQADARLIEAEAEAAALELINSVIQGKPDLLTYQYISKLGPEIDVMLLPNDSPFLFPLPDTGTGVTVAPAQ